MKPKSRLSYKKKGRRRNITSAKTRPIFASPFKPQTGQTKKRDLPRSPHTPSFKVRSLFTPSPFKSSVRSPCYKRAKRVRLFQQSFKNTEANTDQDVDDGICCIEEITKSINEMKDHTEENRLEDRTASNTSVSSKRNKSEELISLVPDVLNEFAAVDGLEETILTFFRQVKEKTFPLNNIAFMLWCEIVRWYECRTTTRMRYSNETKRFWKLGWRLFGGRFLHFMGGYKNNGDITTELAGLGQCSPVSSEINFIVPDEKILRNYDPYDVHGERGPGVYNDIISVLGQNLNNKSACITFDGKKIKQGLQSDSGDVDLLGYEDGPSLADKRLDLQRKLDDVRAITLKLQMYRLDGNKTISVDSREELKAFLLRTLARISRDLFDIKELKKKKEYCKEKLIEKSGEVDWRKGKYVYAVSAVIAFLHDIDDYIKETEDVTDQVCKCIAYWNCSKYIVSQTINLTDCSQYASLPDNPSHQNSRYLKQRTEEWFGLRKQAKITGSTIYAALGCDGLNKQKDHFEKVICGIEGRSCSQTSKMAMEHGSKNEVNAIATIVGKVMPVLYPGLIFCEEGCVVTMKRHEAPFCVVSPDGSLRINETLDSTKIAVEVKCPFYQVHTKFPPRYLLQCLAEIEALGVDSLLYASWTRDDTVIFRVDKDSDLYNEAIRQALLLYGNVKPKKPTKLTDEQKELKKKIFQKSESIQMIGRFTSLINENIPNVYDEEVVDVETIIKVLEGIERITCKHHELQRERASEAVVVLVADLDRSWEKNRIRCSPVCWFPKGYSLRTEIMRIIVEDIHSMCSSMGIHVPCQSFDGQWHGIVTRTKDGEPLTVYQLQKDVWKEAKEKKKSEILSELKGRNKHTEWSFELIPMEPDEQLTEYRIRNIQVTNGNLKFPVYRSVKKPAKVKPLPQSFEETTLASLIPEKVKDVCEFGDEVLSFSHIDEDIEMQAFSGNINEDIWADEIIACREKEVVESDVTCDTGAIHFDVVDSGPRTRNICEEGKESTVEPQVKLKMEDMQCILTLFQTTQNVNRNGKWDSVSCEKLLEYFSNTDQLQKLLDIEMRAVIRYLKKTYCISIKESDTKKKKIQALSKALALECDTSLIKTTSKSRRKVVQVKPLKEITEKYILKNIPKEDLNVYYAELVWPERFRSWYTQMQEVKVDGNDVDWFYKPEFSDQRKQFEVRCVDSTHLLTRTRRKICKGGIEGRTNNAWLRVAKSRKTLLTPVMVEEVIDPMSASMAVTHFSESVEKCMRLNGDVHSADLCRDVRLWWKAEDSPGISSSERHNLRQGLKRRLLNYLNFGSFPPASMYIGGWPVQLWEGLLANIDAKALLHGLCHKGSYNVRAFSSMIGETFFAEVTMSDKRGQGTISCKEFGQFIGNAIEQVQLRLDPERSFSYTTKRATMYKLVEETEESDAHDSLCAVCRNGKQLPTNIEIMNHPFDSKERRRLPGRKKEATVLTDRNSLQKGALGVRWEKARCNQEKILPTKKMGIDGTCE